ncbi:50S ribosomal protein L25 [Rhynchospora pubera]|uniref:50S ribosomal protein L25 n=1 Tax=Rhynchospora pubera TaxID=906938 RepID=A0AAV8DNJ3_9POAL|nr:50S ribosomal protein L25 [Rhynchospora pubera]
MAWRRGVREFLLHVDPAIPRSPAWRRVSSASHHRTIQAVPREASGGRAAAKERAQGRVPSVVVSLSGSAQLPREAPRQLLSTDAKQIKEILKQSPYFCTTPIQLQVRAGVRSSAVLQSGTVLPIKINTNKKTGEILNLIMAWAEKGKEILVKIPLEFKGEDACIGLKKGGYLHKVRNALKYECPLEHIPQKIDVDISNLDIGDKIFAHDLQVDSSLKLLSNKITVPLCEIKAPKPEANSDE